MFNRNEFAAQSTRLKYFEYFLLKMHAFFPANKNLYLNDLSVLKCQKLLFFTVAVNTQSKLHKSVLGNEIFNDFKAYQYGPVEETIYNSLKEQNNELSHINLTFKKSELKFDRAGLQDVINGIADSGILDREILNLIDSSINDLNKKNPFLVKYSPFNLVELTHKWRCWSFSYQKNPRSPILIADIENESMTFAL